MVDRLGLWYSPNRKREIERGRLNPAGLCDECSVSEGKKEKEKRSATFWFCFWFLLLFVLVFWFFEAGFLCIAPAALELAL